MFGIRILRPMARVIGDGVLRMSVLGRGGDALGMNVAVRAVARTGRDGRDPGGVAGVSTRARGISGSEAG